jgi:hypothetical protein
MHDHAMLAPGMLVCGAVHGLIHPLRAEIRNAGLFGSES